MNAPPYLDVPSTVLHSFVVAGISITSLRKQWKPALPKKRQESSYLVVINGKTKSVTFSLAGAAVEMPAITSGPFTAEIPYLQCKVLLTESYGDGALIEFKLSPGTFTIGDLTTKSAEISGGE